MIESRGEGDTGNGKRRDERGRIGGRGKVDRQSECNLYCR